MICYLIYIDTEFTYGSLDALIYMPIRKLVISSEKITNKILLKIISFRL